MNTWAGVATSTWAFGALSLTAEEPVRGGDHAITVFWDRSHIFLGPDETAKLAVTIFSYDAMTGEIRDADVAMNTNVGWTTTGLGGLSFDLRHDVETVVLHELGHSLGLAHSEDSTAVMAAENRGRPYRKLRDDDRRGVTFLYPRNRYPEVSSVTAVPPSITPGQSSTITIIATDADGKKIKFQQWDSCLLGDNGCSQATPPPNGGTVFATRMPGQKVWQAPTATGVYRISVEVTDGVVQHIPLLYAVDVVVASCGNGQCEAGETCSSCPADCPCPTTTTTTSTTTTSSTTSTIPSVCGDDICNGGETCSTCPVDCLGIPTGSPRAYITNFADSTSTDVRVSVLDTGNNCVIARLPIGPGVRDVPGGVVVNSDGSRVYVTTGYGLPGLGTVSVIDTSTNTVIATTTVGLQPVSVVLNPAETRLYVGNVGNVGGPTTNEVSVIDTGSNTVIGTVTGGPGPSGMEVSSDGTKLYQVAHFVGGVGFGVVDIPTSVIQGTRTLPGTGSANGLAINTSETTAYVAELNQPIVAVIDIATMAITATITVGSFPVGVVLHPDGSKLYVANAGSGTVSVADTATNLVEVTIPVGANPVDIATTPDGSRVYVTNSHDRTVSAIDTSTNTVVATVIVGEHPIAFGHQFIGPAPPP